MDIKVKFKGDGDGSGYGGGDGPNGGSGFGSGYGWGAKALATAKALIAFSVAYIIIAHSVDFPPEWLMIKINTIKEKIAELQEDSMIVKVKAGNEVFNLRVIAGPKQTLRTTYQTVRILGKKAGTENIKLLHPEEGPIGVWIGGSRVGVIK